MTAPQAISFLILGATLALFLWGRWRYDVVAMLALLAVVLTGLVPASQAFAGFSHPAVVTVAAVLIISRGLQNAGIVDLVVKALSVLRGRENLQLTAQCAVIAFLSSFMNNVGALALMLPVALRNAYKDGYPPAKTLMPLAFASLLGGLTTLIGTPPNIIIATFRADQSGQAFGMFDFTPVGVAIAVAGLAFLVLLGWRLIPYRDRDGENEDAFAIEDYLTEAEVSDESKAIGMTVLELERLADEDVAVVGVIHDGERRPAPSSLRRIRQGDVLMLRGDAEALKAMIDGAGLRLVADAPIARDDLKSEDIDLVEVVVRPGSRLIGATASSANLRVIHGINMLAIARQGHRLAERLSQVVFRSGDVMLLQGPRKELPEIIARLDCLPLAERSLGIGQQQRLVLATLIFLAAIVSVVAALLPVHIAFSAAATALVVTNIVRPPEIYNAIDWPVIILLGAMFPVGGALENTGGATLVAEGLLKLTGHANTVWALAVLLVATMFLSDVVNNNATAVLMAPIAMKIADQLHANSDGFLMAVAVGASCAFLTPIGHQSNTLVMEPGGYRFNDYWRVGLPLEAVIVLVGLPAILWAWPL